MAAILSRKATLGLGARAQVLSPGLPQPQLQHTPMG